MTQYIKDYNIEFVNIVVNNLRIEHKDSFVGQGARVWLDDVELEDVYAITLTMAADQITRAQITYNLH